MNAIPFRLTTHECLGATSDGSMADGAMDNAWIVLEAANDLRDIVTVELCRRVIDAGLSGRPAAPSDMHVLQNYFR